MEGIHWWHCHGIFLLFDLLSIDVASFLWINEGVGGFSGWLVYQWRTFEFLDGWLAFMIQVIGSRVITFIYLEGRSVGHWTLCGRTISLDLSKFGFNCRAYGGCSVRDPSLLLLWVKLSWLLLFVILVMCRDTWPLLCLSSCPLIKTYLICWQWCKDRQNRNLV